MSEQHADRYDVRTHGVSGQVVVGRQNTVGRTETGPAGLAPVTEHDIAQLREEFARVRALVPEGEPDSDRAQELLDELEESVTGEVDLTTMDYVRGWFTRHLPALATAVAGLVLHPVVTGLVAAAGEDLAEEFQRRFGGL